MGGKSGLIMKKRRVRLRSVKLPLSQCWQKRKSNMGRFGLIIPVLFIGVGRRVFKQSKKFAYFEDGNADVEQLKLNYLPNS